MHVNIEDKSFDSMTFLLDAKVEINNKNIVCERCNFEMISIHCKIKCNNCGYMRDCSDP